MYNRNVLDHVIKHIVKSLNCSLFLEFPIYVFVSQCLLPLSSL